MKVATKLVIAACVPSLLIGGLGYYVMRIGEASLYESVRDNARLRLDALMARVEQTMHRHVVEWRAVGDCPDVRAALRASNTRFASIPNVTNLLDGLDQRWRAGEQERASVLREVGSAELAGLLQRRCDELGPSLFPEATFANRFGACVAAVAPSSDFRQDDESWWHDLGERGLLVNERTSGERSPAESIEVCLRIDEPDGEFLGVLRVVLDTGRLVADVGSRLLEPERERIALRSRSGALIYASEWSGTDHPTEVVASQQRGSHGLLADHGWWGVIERRADRVLARVNQLRRDVALLCLASAGLVLLICLPLALRLSRRIARLRAGASSIGRGDFAVAMGDTTPDELGDLARGMQEMSEQIRTRDEQLREHGEVVARRNLELEAEITQRESAERDRERLHREFQRISHAAGRAEVATNVLHNVGNVLVSVKVALQSARKDLPADEIRALEGTMSLIERHRDDLARFLTKDPKGARLPDLMFEVTRRLRQRHDSVGVDLAQADEHLDHLQEIVRRQQVHARKSGVLQRVVVTDICDAAIEMIEGSLASREIGVVREYDETLELMTDPHRLLEILLNLVSNARDAMDEHGGHLTVRVRGAEDCVVIEIEDDGVGMSPDVVAQVFDHGFTTKQNGHGFGLHASAFAARELSATLEAFSDGAGRGARFVLTLPSAGPTDAKEWVCRETTSGLWRAVDPDV